MRFSQWMACLSASFLVATNPVAAKPVPTHEQLQVPQCLAAKISSKYPVLAENAEFKILNVPSNEIDQLVLLADKVHCGRFLNVTHKLALKSFMKPEQAAKKLLQKKAHAPRYLIDTKYEMKHQEQVNEALALVNADNIWDTLTHLTSFHNRSARQDYGVQAAEWLKARFNSMVVESGRSDTDAYFVETGWYYKQPSLVTVIGKDLKTPAVVIGAHMDTLDGRMPGAGDDGSGSSSAMEAARVLLNSQKNLTHPVYIIWYAAEERGLVGSEYVVSDFMKKNIPVKAVMQFDMTGYRSNQDDATMWVYRDFTNKSLSNFVTDLIKTYVKVPIDYSRCGYACSDHASWTLEGFPAAFPCESSFDVVNPYIHSSSDTMDLMNLEHMTNFTKLGVAFAVELAND